MPTEFSIATFSIGAVLVLFALGIGQQFEPLGLPRAKNKTTQVAAGAVSLLLLLISGASYVAENPGLWAAMVSW